MFDKLKIVLFKPRFIGLYIKENSFKLFLKMSLVILLVLIPGFIKNFVVNEISSEFSNYIITATIDAKIEDVYISDNLLYNENEYVIDCYYFDVMIGGSVSSDNFESITVNKLLFDVDSIRFYVSNIEVYNVAYSELNVGDMDFSNISKTNVVASNQYISVFNKIYKDNNIIISSFFSSALLFDLVINVLSMSLMLALLSFMFNKTTNIMPFKYRFKITLNCQYIYLLSVFISLLYSNENIQFVGTFIMSFYAFKALNSITMSRKGE